MDTAAREHGAQDDLRSSDASADPIRAAEHRVGRQVACRGREAVDATERLICGHGAVESPAVAEGLALAGRRAANLLGAGDAPATPGPSRAPRVHHRAGDVLAGGAAATVFELVAGTAQEAVDHCLVAHHMVARLGEAGTCTVGPETAEALAVVRLPAASAIDDIPGSDDEDLGVPRASQVAPDAFAAVGDQLGRPVQAIVAHQADKADVLLVAVGDARRNAIALSDAARRAGVRCGVLGIAMIRPFPYEELRTHVGDAERIVVLEDPARGAGWLSGAVRAAVVNGGGSPSVAAVPSDASLVDLSMELGREDVTPAPEGAPEPPVVRLAASPGGVWGRELVRALAAELGWLGPVAIDEPPAPRGLSVLRVAQGPQLPELADGPVDVLLVASPEAFDPEVAGPALAPGALVVLMAEASDGAALWSRLTPEQRAVIDEHDLVLRGVDGASLARQSGGREETLRPLLLGAVLEAAEPLRRVVPEANGATLASAVAEALEQEAPGRAAALLRDGARAAFGVEDRTGEPLVETPRELPQMPAATERDESWRERLVRFHLDARRAAAAIDPGAALPLWPAALEATVLPERLFHDYPLFLPVVEGQLAGVPQALGDVLGGALEAMERAGEAHDMLDPHVPRMARAFGLLVAERGSAVADFDEVRDDALMRFGDSFDLSDDARALLREQVRALRKQLPTEGSLLALDDTTLIRLHVAALRRARRQGVSTLHEEIRTLVAKLSDMLRSDDLHDPTAASAGSFGQVGADLFDAASLGSRVAGQKGSQRLGDHRRARIESALAVLRRQLAGRGHADVLVVHPGLVPPEAILPGATKIDHPAALEVAQGLFDGLVGDMVEVFRALRLARLEAEGAYDAELHAGALAAFDADALTPEELMAVPAVVCLETTERLRGTGLASLSELLRSGRPVHVVVADFAARDGAGDARWSTAVGQLAMAHREAMVVSSTLGRPAHLAEGLARMASSLRPSVAVVGVADGDGPVPPLARLAAARDGRATPCFVYDPDGGETWADRLDLSDNPAVEDTWPSCELRYADAEGNEQALELRLTFADVAAVEPALRGSFRVVPPEAWSDDQLEMADYLIAWDAGEAEGKLPFLWVVQADGTLARAVTTRELAFAALDRAHAWRTLQELGGVNNEWARRAAEAAREAALSEAEAERQKLSESHEAEVAEVRSSAAAEAMQRLVDVLMDLDSAPVPRATATVTASAPAPAPAPAPDVEEAPAEADAAEPAPAEEADDDVSFDDPFIDTILCTTCNECTNLNPRLFKYDANKQAYIADASAGTYLDLVVAAEKCPANIIHPGAPRADDSTATPEVIERAKPYS